MLKERQSNFELLRIVSMLMILALHVNFYALGAPSNFEIAASPLGAYTRIFFEFVCIVAVNVFILISGWFGINIKLKGFLKFIFQILFYYTGIYLLLLIIGTRTLSWEGFKECIFAQKTGWFIKAYIGLYIISPVLNTFVEHASRKQLKSVIVAFYIFQTIYGWFFVKSTNFFAQGYSTFSFIGLYLLARYIKLYATNNKYLNKSKKHDITVFFALCVLETILFAVSRACNWNEFTPTLWIYSAPLVIVSALYLIVFFSKLNITNKFINIVAASSFSVYLFHSDPNIMPIYTKTAREIFMNYSSIACLGLIILEILVFYIVATIIDKGRIWLWNKLWNSCGQKIESWFAKLKI